jgi:hypothetical protein
MKIVDQALRRVLPLCAVLTVLALPRAAAGQAAVNGVVLDAETSQPVADVTIRAINEAGRERMRGVSDSAGYFSLALPPGRYTFQAEHIGYRTLNTPSVQVRRGDLVTVEIRVGVAPIAFEPLVVRLRQPNAVTGSERFHRRMAEQKAIGQGRFITRREIDSTSVASINDLLNRQPWLEVRPIVGRTGTNDVVIIRYAGRECLPALYIDGMPVGFTMDTDLRDFYSPDMLEGVEIYRTEVETPPELRRPGCGTVALWTRGQRGNPFSLRRLGIAAGFIATALVARGL